MTEEKDVRSGENVAEDVNPETLRATAYTGKSADLDPAEADKSEITDFLTDLFGILGEDAQAARARNASSDIKLGIAIRELNEEIARQREQRRRQQEETAKSDSGEGRS